MCLFYYLFYIYFLKTKYSFHLTETVKDLIRFLRRDTNECAIRRQLGHAQIVQNDLIPIIKFYPEDKVLFETTIK